MTYKQIAKLANVSLSTVSKALSGSKEISEELSQKIINIAMEQGYFEEKGKRKIEYAKSEMLTVAVVCPEIISIAYARDITAIKNEIEARGGFVSVYVYDFDGDKLNRIIEMITVRNCADGIIVFPTEESSIIKSSIPIVAISHQHDVKYDTVCCDMEACFLDMVKYLKDLGHKRIAFVGEINTMGKLTEYKRGMEKCGLVYNEEDVYIIKERFEQIGYDAADEMLKKGNLPTAVICAYDEIALALIHSFSQNGIEVPGSVSVMGINDIPAASYLQIPLTTVNTFCEEQGSAAINLLYDKILGKSKGIQHITIEHELIKRKSTGRNFAEGK